jgi:hypothetical protein
MRSPVMPMQVGIHVFPCCDAQEVDGGPPPAMKRWVSTGRHVKHLSSVGPLARSVRSFAGIGSPALRGPASKRASNTLTVKRHPKPEVHTLLFVLSVFAIRRGSGPAGQEPITEAYEERRRQH